MTDTDDQNADQTSNVYQPIAYTYDAPYQYRILANRAQRRKIARKARAIVRKRGKVSV